MEFRVNLDYRNCLKEEETQQVKTGKGSRTIHRLPRLNGTDTIQNRTYHSVKMDSVVVGLLSLLILQDASFRVDAQAWVPADNELSTFEGPRGPVFGIEPPHRSTYTNDTGIEIKCQAEGQPRGRIFWTTKDGSLANDVDGLRYVRHDGTLVLRPFASKDYKPAVHTTTYRCGVSNSFGTILSREVNVRAVLRQHYQATVYDAFAFRGNTAVLRCNFPSGLASDVTVEAWIRDDGYSFDSKGIVEESYTFLRSGELLIHDSGPQINVRKYGCRTRSILGGDPVSSTVSGRVIITEPPGPSPPRLLLHKSRVTARVGSTVELPCVAEGNPVPSYRWMKGDTHRHHSVKENYRIWLRSGVMTFRNVRHEDGGIYICIAENAEGQLRSETVLLVTEPLEPIIIPQKQVIDIGKELVLNCTIRGQPVSSISWTKDGQPLSSGSRVTYLSQAMMQIRSVQREDQGMYQCLVHNEEDSAQATAQVLINDVPPTFISVFPSLTSHSKEPVSLSCTISGSPTPKINWFLDDQKVHSTDRVRIDSYVSSRGYVVGYLNFTAVRVEDGGLYECKAENEVGHVSHSARLNVLGPIFVRPLRNITAVSGQTVHIRCPFGGFPIEKITWVKGGETVLMTSRIKMTEEGVLIIMNVDRVSDAGEYKCGVEDSMGHVATGTTILNVLVAPVIDAHYFPEMVPAEENSRTRLICSVSKGDQPINMNWLKNGGPVITRQDLNIQKTDDSAIVSFRKVTAEDSGLYTCTATNMAATVNRTLHLTVNVPPRWTILPTNASTTVGETLRLQCSASGYPVPSITWKKAKGTSSTNFSFVYSSSRIQQFSNGTLLIRESEVSDGGQYLCTANNGIGTGIQAVIHVKIYVPPRMTTKFRSVSKKKGDEVALLCEVSGDIPMSVTWRRNTELIDPALNKRWGATEGRDLPCIIYPATSDLCRSESSRYTFLEKSEHQKLTAEFYIRPLVKEDTGLYNCQVNNSYGKDEAHYQITVQDIPDSPYNVTVVNVTSSAITIQWEIPFDGNSPVKRYIIYYKRESDSWKTHAQQDAVAGTKTLATVKGLKPMTTYHVEVSAENALGEGERSEMVVITTEESVPSGPPEEITVQATGPQSFKVSWKPPRRSLQHGKILGYYIGYKSKKGKDFQYKHVERQEESETGVQSTYVTNLKPATTYAVVVQSYNSAGPGPISDEIFGTTLESAPPTSPRLSASLQDSTKIKVHWERDPKDKSLVTEFELHYRPENGEWRQKRLPPDTTSHDLLDLKCGTRYWFYIKATNSLGTGEPSETFQLRTAGAAPVSPSAEEFITSNKTTIGLRLWAWKSGGCPVTSFTVKYKLKYYQQWQSVAENVVSDEGTYYIRQLLPDREYHLHVTAHSEAGDTEKEYEVRTLGTTLIVTPFPDLSTRTTAPAFHKNLAVFIPVLLSILVVIVVLVLAVLCLWRNWQDRRTPTSLETPRHKSAHHDEGGILMADMAAKKAAAAAGTNNVDLLDMRPKEDYYSSPSKHPTPVASNLRRRDHEYAEPYTALPPPRRLSTEATCRGFIPTNCTHAMEDASMRSTLGRRPSRPDSRASLLFQGSQERNHLPSTAEYGGSYSGQLHEDSLDRHIGRRPQR